MPPELQGQISTACKMFPSACPKVKHKVIIFLHRPLPASIFTVSINGNNQQEQSLGVSYCLVFPYLCAPNTCLYTHRHTHAYTCAPHVISPEAFIIVLCYPIWQLLAIYRYLKCNWSKFDMCYQYEIHTGFLKQYQTRV